MGTACGAGRDSRTALRLFLLAINRAPGSPVSEADEREGAPCAPDTFAEQVHRRASQGGTIKKSARPRDMRIHLCGCGQHGRTP